MARDVGTSRGPDPSKGSGTGERNPEPTREQQARKLLDQADQIRRRAEVERRLGNDRDYNDMSDQAENLEKEAHKLTSVDPIGEALLRGATPAKEQPKAKPAPPKAGPAAPARPATPAPAATSGVAATAGTSTTDLGGTPNPDGLFKVPGGAKVWEGPDKYWYVVYTVPGSNPPVPMAWRIENDDDVAAIFGAGNTPQVARTLTADEWKKAGVLTFGTSRQLANTSEHPFDAFAANFETEAKARPWLRDPEILALTTRAILENRAVTDAELGQTKWWNTHTDGERKWLATVNSAGTDEVASLVRDGRDKVRQAMIAAGVANPPEELVTGIGDRITGGTWTAQYAQNQIVKLADPYAQGDMDPTLKTWVTDLAAKGTTLNTLADNSATVDKLISAWLGPAVGAGWSKAERERWAGKLRNDPQASEELTRTLQQQRLLMFPEYQDPNATYDAIAAPWRGQVQNAWGETIDETDPFFTQVVRSNDLVAAQQMLRQEGRKRGVAKVVYDDLSVVGSAFGGSLRPAA